MAKVKVMDSARELEARAKQLFERIKGMNADMSATLEDMRQYEGKLIEKEKIAEKERAEALRIERLRELANSADTAAYHSDEPETAEPEKPKAEEKSEASAIKSAEPEKASAEPKAEEKSEPAEQKAESAKETAKPEQTKEELKKEADPNAAPTNPSFKEMVSVLKMPTLWVLIVFMLFTNTFYTVFDQQMFPNYYASLFPTTEIGNATYGTLNSFQVFLESAMMGVVPIIMKKIGVRNSLLLGATVMFARIGLCGVFHDPVSVSIVKLFHSIEVPLFCLPAFRYFTLHFDTKLSATLYMVGFQIASQVGQVIFSTPMGALHDAMGDRPTFFTISAIVFAALVYGFFVIKKDDQEVGGDPFYTDKQLKAMKAADAEVKA